MEKVLITGGSGFIGTNLCLLLIKLGYEICFIDSATPKVTELESYWVKCDILELDLLEKTFFQFDPDIVIHLAARTDLNGKTLEDYKANIEGVSNLINISKKSKRLRRVIFTSSMYVCKPGYKPKGDNDYKPHTVYGESKELTEKLIKEADPNNYTWCIIRPTSIWGPYFGEPYNLFFKMVLSRKYFHMGDKACSKTYGYIDNFNFQLMALVNAESSKISKKTFYLGDYDPYNITDWANEIATIVGIKIPKIPFSFFRVLAFFGDCLGIIGIKFPMTSFRLKNMTTDNIHDLSQIQNIVPQLPISRKEGTLKTVNWLKNGNK